MLAVHMVLVRKISVGETAANLMRSERWVRTWLERLDAGGFDGLRDLPRSSRSMQTRRWEASSDYTQAFHQAARLPNATAWNAVPYLPKQFGHGICFNLLHNCTTIRTSTGIGAGLFNHVPDPRHQMIGSGCGCRPAEGMTAQNRAGTSHGRPSD